MTHADLVEAGRKWLAARSPVVITEITSCSEEPDVLGFQVTLRHPDLQYGVFLLECKVSRSDFLSDSKKIFRVYPEEGLGDYRYYLTPQGLISVDELPNGWGLLECSGKRIRVIKQGSRFDKKNNRAETNILLSVLRRVEISGKHHSIRVYPYETKNRATLTINEEAKDERTETNNDEGNQQYI
jgi:hypothetical protein